MQSEETMKKLADNFGTLVMVSKRHPSSMSRLKNLLIAEGVSETSARRKIAELDTEAGCMVIEEYGSLKLNYKLLSQMFLQIQSELKFPNHFEEEYKTRVVALERKIEKLEKGNTDEFNALKLENEKKNGVIETLKNDAEKKKEAYERSHRIDWNFYLEASRKLGVAEEKIARMKKGIYSYLKVCWGDHREARLKEKSIKKEAKERHKRYAELERKWEEDRKQKEKRI